MMLFKAYIIFWAISYKFVPKPEIIVFFKKYMKWDNDFYTVNILEGEAEIKIDTVELQQKMKG